MGIPFDDPYEESYPPSLWTPPAQTGATGKPAPPPEPADEPEPETEPDPEPDG